MRRADCPFQKEDGGLNQQRDRNLELVNPGRLKRCPTCGVAYYDGEVPQCS